MTRQYGGVAVMVHEGGRDPRGLRHLVHKSRVLDWTKGTGPGAGNAPSDLARSIVGDVLGRAFPAPNLYRELTLALHRIPHEGGELTEDEVLELLEGVS